MTDIKVLCVVCGIDVIVEQRRLASGRRPTCSKWCKNRLASYDKRYKGERDTQGRFVNLGGPRAPRKHDQRWRDTFFQETEAAANIETQAKLTEPPPDDYVCYRCESKSIIRDVCRNGCDIDDRPHMHVKCLACSRSPALGSGGIFAVPNLVARMNFM